MPPKLKPFLWGVGLVALFAFPFLARALEKYYWIRIGSLIGIYAILALGLNMVIGWCGLLDLGFMAFYAIGAYTAALLSSAGWSFWSALPAAALLGVLGRFLLGIPVLRLRGDYLAIVTLGFGEIVRIVLNNWDSLTNGPKGLPAVGEIIRLPALSTAWLDGALTFLTGEITLRPILEWRFRPEPQADFYILIWLFTLFGFFACGRIQTSRIGRAAEALREDETAAEMMGVPTTKLKLFVFGLSSLFAALAGALYAHWVRFVSPESFTFWESVMLVSMVLLGGSGNNLGVIAGAALLVALPEILRGASQLPALSGFSDILVNARYLVFGLALVAFSLFRPQGIFPDRRRQNAA